LVGAAAITMENRHENRMLTIQRGLAMHPKEQSEAVFKYATIYLYSITFELCAVTQYYAIELITDSTKF
jgi:hypothetical protein